MMDMEESYEPSDSKKYNGDSDGGGSRDDLTAALEEAFDDHEWTPERVAGMKEAIRICMEEDYGDDEKSKPDDKSGLALIFGPGKSKK